MIRKTLHLATLLVVAWLLWQQAGLRQDNSALMQAHIAQQQHLSELSNTIRQLDQRRHEQPALAAALPATPNQSTSKPDQSAEINGLKAEIAKYQGQITKLHKTSELKETLATVIEAELAKHNDPSGAADTLLATKETIWRTSTEHKSVEQTLQSLMAPIDILAGEWAEGYTDNSVETIHNILSKAVVVLESEGTTQR